MPKRPLSLAGPLARVPFLASALTALLLFGTVVFRSLGYAVNPGVISAVFLGFFGAQLAASFALAGFTARASARLDGQRARRRAPTAAGALLMTLPVISHFLVWSRVRGLLEDSRGLVGGGGEDGRVNLAIYVVNRFLSSFTVFASIVLAVVFFTPNTAGVEVVLAFFVTTPTLVAAVAGAVLLRRIERRFGDAFVHDGRFVAFGLSTPMAG